MFSGRGYIVGYFRFGWGFGGLCLKEVREAESGVGEVRVGRFGGRVV